LLAGFATLAFAVPTLFFTLEGVDRKDLDSNPPQVTGALAAVGVLAFGTGTALVINGSRAHARFDTWRAANPTAVAYKDGTGLLAGGALATIFGSGFLVWAGVANHFDESSYTVVPALIGVGAVELAAGIGLLSWGLVRRSRYDAWRARTTAMVVPLPRGAGLGLVGRF
jgi:hypothetical protein